jgi:hypothetical protein
MCKERTLAGLECFCWVIFNQDQISLFVELQFLETKMIQVPAPSRYEAPYI